MALYNHLFKPQQKRAAVLVEIELPAHSLNSLAHKQIPDFGRKRRGKLLFHNADNKLAAAFHRFQRYIAGKSVGNGNVAPAAHYISAFDIAYKIDALHLRKIFVSFLMQRVALMFFGAVG